jgi:mannose-6-phosphate isomerase
MDRVAEAWWGSHSSGPAYIGTKPLSNIPYLLKVISVDRALSIQVHPDAVQAPILHAKYPELYPDANPKPEMALALTDFRALCGFLPDDQIRFNLLHYSEFAAVAGGVDVEPFDAIRNVLTCTDFQAHIDSLRTKLEQHSFTLQERTILELIQQYPTDVGVFAPFYMNIIKLNPGEALVIPPHEIHAYLSGTAVECMAPSDNVVRAGLTTKHKDIPTLLSLITPGHTPPVVLSNRIMYDHPITRNYFRLYKPLRHIEYIRRPTIALVVSGRGRLGGHKTRVGDSFLVVDHPLDIEGIEVILACSS